MRSSASAWTGIVRFDLRAAAAPVARVSPGGLGAALAAFAAVLGLALAGPPADRFFGLCRLSLAAIALTWIPPVP
jgi:hypothetical protein